MQLYILQSQHLKTLNKLNSQKPHIAIYGKCNAGKSSLMNILIGSTVSIISEKAGTTTDAVKRNIEISGVGAVVVYDTAGFDDSSQIGKLRVESTLNTLLLVDLAVVVVGDKELKNDEIEFVEKINVLSIPYVIVVNSFTNSPDGFNFSAPKEGDRDALFALIANALPHDSYMPERIFGEKVKSGDTVLLVCPIDSEAPVGRLVPVQTQAIRELLDIHAVAITVQPEQILSVIAKHKVDLVVADSSVIDIVTEKVGNNIEITTFSIILAESKGDKELYTKGLKKIYDLREGDKVLILESCLHQVSCDDIGRVKLPMWLQKYCGCNLEFKVVTATDPLPEDLSVYALALQCGGCMVTRRQLQQRLRVLKMNNVAVTNYGMAIKKIK